MTFASNKIYKFLPVDSVGTPTDLATGLVYKAVVVDANGAPITKYAPYVIAQSAVPVSVGASSAEETVATIAIPANAMGPNGLLRIWTLWSFTNGADDKILRVRFSGAAGTQYLAATQTTTAGYYTLTEISNRGATNSQVGHANINNPFTNTTVAPVTSAVDTAAATTIVITGQKETAGDTLTLERYLVEVLYGA